VPSSRRVLTDQSVHRLAEQVGVPGVPAILLDQVAEEPAQAGMATVGPGDVDEPVESAVGQGRVEPRAGPFDGAVPEGVELFGGVVGGRGELPVVTAIPVGGVPRRADRLSAQLGREDVVLLGSEMLEQAAEGQRGGADAGLQSGCVEVVGLPPEGRAQAVERTDEVLGLGAGEGWFPRVVAAGHGATVNSLRTFCVRRPWDLVRRGNLDQRPRARHRSTKGVTVLGFLDRALA